LILNTNDLALPVPESLVHQVGEDYVQDLRRDPDPAGLSYWSGVAEEFGLDAARAGILGTDEYLRIALTPSVTVVPTPNPSQLGQEVSVTATVTPGAPGTVTPTGTATLLDGTTVLNTEPLDGNGQARFTTAALALNSHQLTVQYSGDGIFLPATSPAVTQNVGRATPSAIVMSALNPSTLGQAVTFTATVSPGVPGLPTPTGMVTFLDGQTALDTEQLDAGGQARFTTAKLLGGSHQITVAYSGDGNFLPGTSPAITQVVARGQPSVTVMSLAQPDQQGVPSVERGQQVTFKATVSPSTSAPVGPTGTVTFLDGQTVLGTKGLDASGTASLTTSFSTSKQPFEEHQITAVYNGDSNFLTARTKSTITQRVTPASVTVHLDPSQTDQNPAPGEDVTFTVILKSVTPGLDAPTGGDVALEDGTTKLSGSADQMVDSSNPNVKYNPDGTVAVTLHYTFPPPTPPATSQTHTITAVYSGDDRFLGPTTSDNSITETVALQGTTPTLRVYTANDPNPNGTDTISIGLGQQANLMATVESNATAKPPNTPVTEGTVTFMFTAPGLSSRMVTGTSDGAGHWTATTPSDLAAGTYSVVAQYRDTGGAFNGNDSAPPRTLTVNPGTITFGPPPPDGPLPGTLVRGQSFTVTATASVPGSFPIVNDAVVATFTDSQNNSGATIQNSKITQDPKTGVTSATFTFPGANFPGNGPFRLTITVNNPNYNPNSTSATYTFQDTDMDGGDFNTDDDSADQDGARDFLQRS
jgi:hypothetical protein